MTVTRAQDDEPETPRPGFRDAIETVINSYSMENGSNTPDFLLAEYLTDCLAAFDKAVTAREKWYGRSPRMLDNLPGPENP